MSFVQNILRDGFPLGRAFGIPVTLNPSLIPIALIMMIGIASGLDHGGWNVPIGAAMVVIVFGSILLHELGHSLTARQFGIETRSINLHLFGGVAQILREPRRPIEEFLIAVAGPAVSLFLAAFFGLLAAVTGWLWFETPVGQLVMTPLLGGMAANLILGLFNLLPGFPMDGGRVLRAFLWHRWGDLPRATHAAATGGEIVGFTLVFLGAVRLLVFLDIGGLFTCLVAFFIISLARMEKRRASSQRWSAATSDPQRAYGSNEPVGTDGEPPVRVIEYIVRYPDGREVTYTRRR